MAMTLKLETQEIFPLLWWKSIKTNEKPPTNWLNQHSGRSVCSNALSSISLPSWRMPDVIHHFCESYTVNLFRMAAQYESEEEKILKINMTMLMIKLQVSTRTCHLSLISLTSVVLAEPFLCKISKVDDRLRWIVWWRKRLIPMAENI